jgi:hypothetical protein
MVKMKNFLLMCLVFLFGFHASGQVSMTAQVPPEGVLMKAQLWNIVLVSVGTEPVTVKVILRLTDIRTNQPVLTGITNDIMLRKGAKQLQASDVAPIQYEYLSDIADRNPNGLLSAGNYQACYSIIVQGGYKGEPVAEDCIPFTVAPVGPPLLNTPADQSVLESFNPQFTWLPPSPVTIFSNLNYELLLTEVRNGQSAVEAVQYNMPVYRLPSTRNLFANYPSSAMSLDTGKQYAWTVIAKNGNAFAAQTDVWTFRLKSNLVKRDEEQISYVQLRKEIDGAVAAVGTNIYFTYVNEVNDTTVQYELLGLETGNNVLQSGVLSLNPGGNMLAFEIKKKYHLVSGKSYLFRLKNARHEYWQVKFIYHKAH